MDSVDLACMCTILWILTWILHEGALGSYWGSQVVARRSFSDERSLAIIRVGTPTVRHMRYANKLLDRPVLFAREAYCQNLMRPKLSPDI